MSLRLRYLSTTLAVLAAGGAIVLIQARDPRPASLPRVRPASTAPAVRPAAPLVSARQILDRAAELSLTAEQRARLEALDREWRQESASLEAEVQAARAAVSRFMEAEAQAGRRTSLPEIERRSAEFRELSAMWRERRRLHGDAAGAMLTAAQRGTLGPPPETHGGGR